MTGRCGAAAADSSRAGSVIIQGIGPERTHAFAAVPGLGLGIIGLTAVGVDRDGQVCRGTELPDQGFNKLGRGTVDADHFQSGISFRQRFGTVPDQVAFMKNGRVVETSEDPATFFAGPEHPYSRSLVAEARKMELDPSA